MQKKQRKKTNQKLSNWSFGKFTTLLTYKAKTEDIEVMLVNEAYTSQTCPVCETRKKVTGRNYRCRCGYQKHRDIHGACNILTKYKMGRFAVMHTTDPTYLRPV